MLQEATAAPGGRHVEILGSYDPHQKVAVLKEERIKYWLSQGAQASDTVYNLLVSKSLVSDKKRVVKIPKKEEPASPARLAETPEKRADGEVKAEETSAEGGKAEDKNEEVKPEEKVEKVEEKTESADAPAMADKEVKSE